MKWKRYLHVTLERLEQLSENRSKAVPTSALMSATGKTSTHLGHLLTTLEKAGLVRYRYGTGLPEDGA
jgi:DNA-binding IscR family transcriptional regulator